MECGGVEPNHKHWKRELKGAIADFGIVLAVGTAFVAPAHIISEQYKSNLYKQAGMIADVNKDGNITQEEWVDAYLRANKKLLSTKDKFSNSDLENIIKYGQ